MCKEPEHGGETLEGRVHKEMIDGKIKKLKKSNLLSR